MWLEKQKTKEKCDELFLEVNVVLKRKANDFLISWKNSNKKPLIIKGARQIGKMKSINYFVLEV